MAPSRRGRLSSIELLPDEAQPHVAWASRELADRDRTQDDIRDELNTRLAHLGLGPISSSAFNRHSIRLAATMDRISQTNQMVRVMAERMDGRSSDELTIMVTELGKTLLFELLQSAGEAGIDPKGAQQLASAARQFATAQSVSSKRRTELEVQMAEQTDDALERAQVEGGLTADMAAQIRRDVLGVRG